MYMSTFFKGRDSSCHVGVEDGRGAGTVEAGEAKLVAMAMVLEEIVVAGTGSGAVEMLRGVCAC